MRPSIGGRPRRFGRRKGVVGKTGSLEAGIGSGRVDKGCRETSMWNMVMIRRRQDQCCKVDA